MNFTGVDWRMNANGLQIPQVGEINNTKFSQDMKDNKQQNSPKPAETPQLGVFDVGSSFNDGVLYGINSCNADYQLALQQIHKELNDLRRIRKKDVQRILEQFTDINLGDDVNPFLEDASE